MPILGDESNDSLSDLGVADTVASSGVDDPLASDLNTSTEGDLGQALAAGTDVTVSVKSEEELINDIAAAMGIENVDEVIAET